MRRNNINADLFTILCETVVVIKASVRKRKLFIYILYEYSDNKEYEKNMITISRNISTFNKYCQLKFFNKKFWLELTRV